MQLYETDMSSIMFLKKLTKHKEFVNKCSLYGLGIRDARNRFSYIGSVFEEKLGAVWNEFGSVRKTRFGSDITVTCYLRNG